MSPPYIQLYLFFGGQCTAALDYYTKHLGAETIMILRYQDSPEPPPPGIATLKISATH